MTNVGFTLDVDIDPPQDVNIVASKTNGNTALLVVFIFSLALLKSFETKYANGNPTTLALIAYHLHSYYTTHLRPN